MIPSSRLEQVMLCISVVLKHPITGSLFRLKIYIRIYMYIYILFESSALSHVMFVQITDCLLYSFNVLIFSVKQVFFFGREKKKPFFF